MAWTTSSSSSRPSVASNRLTSWVKRSYFNSGDAIRLEKETLTDYEQRVSVHFRDIARALQEMGTTATVPTENDGWLLLNKHIRLEPSDVATVKSQASSYRLDDVWTALRKMWGGDSLTIKDMERRKLKTYMATVPEQEDDESADGSVWWNDAETVEESETADAESLEGNEVWFEEALEAYNADPSDGAVYANFQEAKKAFYKDARRALDQHRVNRGFYQGGKGRGKGSGKGKTEAGHGEVHEVWQSGPQSYALPSVRWQQRPSNGQRSWRRIRLHQLDERQLQ